MHAPNSSAASTRGRGIRLLVAAALALAPLAAASSWAATSGIKLSATWPENEVLNLHLLPTGHGVAGTTQGQIYQSHDEGRTWALSAQQPDSALEFKVSEVKRVWQVASHCSLAWATIDGFVDDFRTAYMWATGPNQFITTEWSLAIKPPNDDWYASGAGGDWQWAPPVEVVDVVQPPESPGYALLLGYLSWWDPEADTTRSSPVDGMWEQCVWVFKCAGLTATPLGPCWRKPPPARGAAFSGFPTKLSATSIASVWAGYDDGRVDHWAGAGWAQRRWPRADGSDRLEGLVAVPWVAPPRAWLVIRNETSSQRSAYMRQGSVWQKMHGPTPNELWSLTVPGPQYAAVLERVTPGARVLQWKSGGTRFWEALRFGAGVPAGATMRWGAAVHALSGTHAVLVCVVPNGTGGYKVVSAALAAGGTKWVALPDVPSSLTGSYVAYFSDYPWQGAYLDGVTALPAGRAVFSASGQVGVRHLE